MGKAASLNNSGVMKVQSTAAKGEAKATTPHETNETPSTPSQVPPVPSKTDEVPSAQAEIIAARRLLPTRSMTVKVDEISYKKLKNHGLAIGKSSQDIFLESLAMYFKVNNI